MDTKRIQLQPYKWDYEDFDDNLEIRCWALNRESKACVVRIKDYTTSCYIEIPNNEKWGSNYTAIVERLTGMLNYNNNHGPVSYKIVKKYKIYYHQKKQTNFILLTFRNLESLNHCKNILKKPLKIRGLGEVKLSADINSKASCVRKFITEKNMKYTQWFDIEDVVCEDFEKISTLDLEYIVSYKDIIPIDENETTSWVAYPGILAFDIETYSHNHNKFSDKYDENDIIYMVSCIYQKGNEERKRYGIIFGDCNDIDEKDLPNTKIVKTTGEIELIKEFCNVIKLTDPEVITGYNIFGFDYPYMNVRLSRNIEDWPVCGRILNKIPYMSSKKWKSGAYGSNIINNLMVSGRVNIDVLPAVKRNYKLRKYTLDFVSNYFLGKTKHDVSAKEMFRIYKKSIDVGDKETTDEMTKVMRYCIQDSELVLDLINKLNIWFDMIETSGIVGVNIDDVDTRGQQIRCYSQIYDVATKNGYVIDSREQKESGFEGGLVPEPIIGIHYPVAYFDFASMYPNIIIANNLCYTTLINPDKLEEYDEKEIKTIDFEQEEKEEDTTVQKKYSYKWHKRKGILPILLDNLLKERKRVKILMKNTKDPMEKMILNMRQLAIKVSANSVFGFTGVRDGVGLMPLVEVARTVTATGRNNIRKVNKFCLDNYENVKIVYGDTDSTLMTIGEKDPKRVWEKAEKMAVEINKLFEDNEEIEVENVVKIFLMKKKKYVFLKYDKNGIIGNELNSKGVILARREACEWVKNVYKKLLKDCLNGISFESALLYLIGEISSLMNDKINLKDLSMNQAMGENYKSESYFMASFGKKLLKSGYKCSVGERLEYIIVNNGRTLLGEKLELVDKYDKKYPIDYDYYLIKKLKPSIDQLFTMAFNKEAISSNFNYRKNNRSNNINLTEPVKYIHALLINGKHKEINDLIKYLIKKKNGRRT